MTSEASEHNIEGLSSTNRSGLEHLAELDERVATLPVQGRLLEPTLREYFGDTRFEQIAESNALEGSTLDVGETQLAVL